MKLQSEEFLVGLEDVKVELTQQDGIIAIGCRKSDSTKQAYKELWKKIHEQH